MTTNFSSALRGFALVAASGLCGFSWGHPCATWLVAIVVLVPLLWHLAGNRWLAGAVMAAYYLAGSRGLPIGTGIFFAESAPAWMAWALWFGAAAVNVIAWLLVWSPNPGRRIVLMPLALIATALPPLGIVGWNNPLTVAGLIFPGVGLVGLVAVAALMAALVSRRSVFIGIALTYAVLCNGLVALHATPTLASWTGHDTHFLKLQSSPEHRDFISEGERLAYVSSIARNLSAGEVAVLPETILPSAVEGDAGSMEVMNEISARLERKGATVLVGMELEHKGASTQNTLVVLGQGHGVAMVQRVPVPVGMWRPWAAADQTFEARMFTTGVVQLLGKKVAYSICNEQLLVWPMVLSLAQSPDVLVGAANDWWARTTSVPAIQNQTLTMWARLAGVPLVKAMNG